VRDRKQASDSCGCILERADLDVTVRQ
jgi:hypothetical protein